MHVLNSFFAELKRRNIFRVASVYAVVGWIVMQVISVMTPALNLPDWVDSFCAIILIAGFPIAMLLAWAFELTPEGVKRTNAVAPEDSITADTSRKLDYAILAGLVLVAGLIAFQTFRSSSPTTTPPPNAEVGEASIAVLPFVDLSPNGDQEYFGDGISEELLNVMAQVKELEVAGRTSSFAFKGQNKDLREIAEILDVAHILEGSVRKSGDKIRVTAQLIRADNGFHMWSDTYDGDLSDVFAFQDEIANAILTELKPMLTNEVAPVAIPRTDIGAYDLYLLAQQKAAGADTIIGYKAAVEALDKALSIDPNFVPALAWRGYYEIMLSDAAGAAGDIPAEKARKNAAVWINKALKLDPKSADALFAQAGLFGISSNKKGERAGAGKLYEQALAIKPNFPLARNDYGYWLAEQGRVQEAFNQFEKALAHDPALADTNINLILGRLRFLEFDKAEKQLDRWATISPQNVEPINIRSFLELQKGNIAESLKLRRRALEIAPDYPRISNGMARTEVHLGIFDGSVTNPEIVPQVKIEAYLLQGKKKDALKISREAIAERPDYFRSKIIFLAALHEAGEWAEIVRYYDLTWGSADAFNQDFPYPPFGFLIPALQDANHPDTEQLIQLARALLEQYTAAGEKSASIDDFKARLLILEGKTELAMDALEHAYNNGARDLLWFIDPAFQPLSGTPRFEMLKKNTGKAINTERAKLNLPPMEMPKPLFNSKD